VTSIVIKQFLNWLIKKLDCWCFYKPKLIQGGTPSLLVICRNLTNYAKVANSLSLPVAQHCCQPSCVGLIVRGKLAIIIMNNKMPWLHILF
jgi:hypothetical protein